MWNVNSHVVKVYIESKKDNLENGFLKPEYPFNVGKPVEPCHSDPCFKVEQTQLEMRGWVQLEL